MYGKRHVVRSCRMEMDSHFSSCELISLRPPILPSLSARLYLSLLSKTLNSTQLSTRALKQALSNPLSITNFSRRTLQHQTLNPRSR